MLLRSPKACLLLLGWTALSAAGAQEPAISNLVTSGKIAVAGQMTPYKIRHLPPDSFPELPEAVNRQLQERGCLVPQTYEARRPENVIQGSFERAGSSDWAVLCSAHGTVSLLVFFGSSKGTPLVLGSTDETKRLQRCNSTGELGFNWGIDPASAQSIHEAQIGMTPRPPRLDHDAIGDSVIDRKTVYRYYNRGTWSVVDMPAQ